MSFIQNLYTSRDNNADPATFVGQQDRLWWNPDVNAFFVNAANIPGGTPVGLSSTTNISVNSITANSGTINGNFSVTGNISPAGANKIGGIAPGPGVVIGTNGILTIDSANLPVSFGNFYAANNVLSIVNVDEDMILQTDGDAEIQLIGNIGFYKPDGIPPNVANRYASFSSTGLVEIYVTNTDTVGAVSIVGGPTKNTINPGLQGAMLHVTGIESVPSRSYFDGDGNYVAWVARRWNGNVAAPTQVLANEDVLRVNATAATNAGVGNVAMAQIRATALENQTTTAQGSAITFTVTPVGSAASARVDVANITVANGVTATKFNTTGNITGGNLVLTANVYTDYVFANNVGSASNVEIESNDTYWYFTTDNRFVGNGNVVVGNVTATNYTGNVTGTATTATSLAAATSILAGKLTIDPANINKNSASIQTFTLTGLTTNHKIVITPGTELTFGVTISAAWASAADTLSIEFQNATGGGVNLGNTDIQYFAWV